MRTPIDEDSAIPTIRFRALARLAQLISSSLDRQQVLDAIAHAATELLPGVTTASIWTADEERRVLELQAFSHDAIGAGDPAVMLRYGEGVSGWVAEHRRPLEVPDLSSDPRVVARDWLRSQGLTSYVAMPIEFQDALLGVLALFGREALRLEGGDRERLRA